MQITNVGLPLYRLLGGFRDRIQTSATIPLANPLDSVEVALERAIEGFRMLKIKECVRGPASALNITVGHNADSISVKLATCGGFRGT